MKTKDILQMEIGRKKIPDDDVMLLCSFYQTILKAGVQISKATSLVSSQVENKKLKEILRKALQEIDSGKAFSYALEKHSDGYLPKTFFETIRAGEHSGDLVKSFGTLKGYYSKQSKVTKQIKNALIYPSFVLAVAVVVLIVVMAFVMPQLVNIFQNMGGEIPAITKALIAISNFFKDNVVLIIFGLIIVVLLLVIYGKSEKGRIKIDSIKIRMPFFGKIILYNNFATYANTLSMLLGSGVILTKALRVLAGVFDNSVFSNSCVRLSRGVESGKRLSYVMTREECFPKTLCEMIGIGEETGEIEEILKTIGEYYSDESENATKNMLSKLEPTMLVIVAGLAGFIVFAIYIPLFQMYDLF